MIKSLTSYIESMLPYLSAIGDYVYALVFVAALLESLPLIGVFLPGTFLLIFLGYLSGEGVIHLTPAILLAAAGAFTGELIGYYLGKYGGNFVHEQIKFLKAAHVEAAQKYFSAHGGKSVFVGRFIGPIRSVISVVAGMSSMKTRVFNFYNALGALLWSGLYMSLGYFFGQEWRRVSLYAKNVTNIFLIILLISIITFIGVRYIKNRNKKILEN